MSEFTEMACGIKFEIAAPAAPPFSAEIVAGGPPRPDHASIQSSVTHEVASGLSEMHNQGRVVAATPITGIQT